MVQNLNNNLLTAAELSGLRRKMRNWESKVSFCRIFEASNMS